MLKFTIKPCFIILFNLHVLLSSALCALLFCQDGPYPALLLPLQHCLVQGLPPSFWPAKRPPQPFSLELQLSWRSFARISPPPLTRPVELYFGKYIPGSASASLLSSVRAGTGLDRSACARGQRLRPTIDTRRKHGKDYGIPLVHIRAVQTASSSSVSPQAWDGRSWIHQPRSSLESQLED